MKLKTIGYLRAHHAGNSDFLCVHRGTRGEAVGLGWWLRATRGYHQPVLLEFFY